MTNAPLVSVVMPTYNAMPYLPQAVLSIFAQTLKEWELIIVDDGSTDGSSEYIERIDDSRVRVHKNVQNCGVSRATNTAVAMATGKYIARMDADDISVPRRLEAQVALLENNKEVDVVGCGTIRTTSNLKVVDVRRPPESHKEITRLVRLDTSLIHGPNFAITDGSLVGRAEWFRRWPYAKCGIPEDFEIMARAFRQSTFGNLPEPLYIYRRGGVTGKWWRQVVACRVKARCIAKYCFFPGNRMRATLALASLGLRPFTAACVYAGAAIPGARGFSFTHNVSDADRELVAATVEQMARYKVPLRPERTPSL